MSDSKDLRVVGRVVGLWRYPVKSMAPEELDEVEVSWHGLIGDRRWAFIRNGSTRSGFPWLTLRECAEMNHYVPAFEDPERPDQSSIIVRTPTGASYDITDPTLTEELCSGDARLIRQNRGIFDTFPLSLITTQTVLELGERVGTPLDVRRFRPNLLVEASEDRPFPEDSWVGAVLRIGSMRMRVDKRDGRCVVITIDPDTTERRPEILRTVARDREGCLGVYGSTVEPGHIRRGDQVHLE